MKYSLISFLRTLLYPCPRSRASPCSSRLREGLVEGDDPPHAILARAQELHLLAQSPTQAAEVRMEMLAKSRRLLEGLIGSLEATAALNSSAPVY